MELLEQIKNWLVTFPQWDEQVLHIDTTAGKPDCCGLFPLGQELLETKQDVLGNVSQKLRYSFLLRRVAPRQESAAVWLLPILQLPLKCAIGPILQPLAIWFLFSI